MSSEESPVSDVVIRIKRKNRATKFYLESLRAEAADIVSRVTGQKVHKNQVTITETWVGTTLDAFRLVLNSQGRPEFLI